MIKNFAFSIFAFLSTFLFVTSSSAQFPIAGQVVDIVDAKTMLVVLPSGTVKVELQYIDVPDAGEQLYDTVREHLRELTLGKSIEYRPKSISRDRAIGRVTIKGIDISQQMLRDGAAWHLPMDASGEERSEYETYASNEALAKNEKLGVWSISGLRPPWKIRAEKKAAEMQKERAWVNPRSNDQGATAVRKKPPTNPAFGDVGSLLNRYDALTKRGLLSTMLLPVSLDKSFPEGIKNLEIDFTYYYRESETKGRTGTFVFTAVFSGEKERFQSNNDLYTWWNEKKTLIARPKRRVTSDENGVRETLIYEVDRKTLQRVATEEGVMLKIGNSIIYPTGMRYLLYNMLDVTQ